MDNTEQSRKLNVEVTSNDTDSYWYEVLAHSNSGYLNNHIKSNFQYEDSTSNDSFFQALECLETSPANMYNITSHENQLSSQTQQLNFLEPRKFDDFSSWTEYSLASNTADQVNYNYNSNFSRNISNNLWSTYVNESEEDPKSVFNSSFNDNTCEEPKTAQDSDFAALTDSNINVSEYKFTTFNNKLDIDLTVKPVVSELFINHDLSRYDICLPESLTSSLDHSVDDLQYVRNRYNINSIPNKHENKENFNRISINESVHNTSCDWENISIVQDIELEDKNDREMLKLDMNYNDVDLSISDATRSDYFIGSWGVDKMISFLNKSLQSFVLHSYQKSKEVAIITLIKLKANPWIANSTGCATESFLFAAERLRYLVAVSSHVLTADDPETQHLKYLSAGLHGGSWNDITRLTSRHTTLSLVQRKLIEDEYQTAFFEATDKVVTCGTSLQYTSQQIHSLIQHISLPEISSNMAASADDDIHLELSDTEEATYQLTRIFLPPTFAESSFCSACMRQFSLALYRHHCRNCGKSFCDTHSFARRRLLHLGITVAVRVCSSCALSVDQIAWDDEMHWKLVRIQDYLSGRLKPYTPSDVDRHVDKLTRVTDYSLQFLKNTLCLSYPAMLALETINILKRYGLSGLAGVLLRKDFIEAVDTLKSISGLEKAFPLSLPELTACIYYLLLLNRGFRGDNPELEHRMHSPLLEAGFHGRDEPIITPTSNVVDDELPTDVNEIDLSDALRLAPLALKAVYCESEVECQRMGLLQGFDLLCCELTSAPEQPAYALLGTSPDLEVGVSRVQQLRGNGSAKDAKLRKEVILAIRGTNSVQDVVTDIRANPIHFPPPLSCCSEGLSPALNEPASSTRDAWVVVQKGIDEDLTNNSGDDSDSDKACGGMARAALWLMYRIGPCLVELRRNGCDIYIVGHSMGGGVAALLTYLLLHTDTMKYSGVSLATNAVRHGISGIKCVTYGSPCCMTSRLADALRSNVLSVVLHDDIISRLTPLSIRRLLKELMVLRGKAFHHGSAYKLLEQDWFDIRKRLLGFWTPKQRTVIKLKQSTVMQQTSDDVKDSQNGETTHADEKHSNEVKGEESYDDGEIVDEENVLEIWLPGRIMHIYSHRGQYKAMMIPRTLSTLRRIEVQGNIFTDHSCAAQLQALQEVSAVRDVLIAGKQLYMDTPNDSQCKNMEIDYADHYVYHNRFAKRLVGGLGHPPSFQPFSQDIHGCHCCHNAFNWHSTFSGTVQQARDKHNCRNCGALVCGPCSKNRHPIGKFGLIFPVRICDICVSHGSFAKYSRHNLYC